MKGRVLVAVFLASILAFALRCPRLSERPMHNDEGVNAIKFRDLWERNSYKYDPTEFHGPSLYYATLAVERLTGGPSFEQFTEARLRWVTLLFGIGLILLIPLLVDGLGKNASIWAALLTAVSPAFVFYSRDYIHEMLLVFFTFLALVSGWRYWRTRKLPWALLAGAGVGFMWATKETFIITLGAAGIALALNHFWNRNLDASGLPINAPRLNLFHLGAAFGICLLVWLLMFSSFFTNARGLPDSFRTYSSWFHRAAGDSAHIHPWYFYFERLLYFRIHNGPIWSEGLIFVLAVIGAIAAFARKGLSDANASFVRFLTLYTFAVTGAYSLISYKTPWCLLNFWQGMILLAGVGAAVLIHAARFQWAKSAATILLLAGAAQLAAQAWQAAVPRAADRRNPYVYAQTSSSVLELIETVNGLAEVSPAKHHLRINVIAPDGAYWPLPWYLRGFDQIGWWDKLPDDPFAPVMIVSAHLNPGPAERESHPMRGVFELRPGVFLKLYVESQLWRDYVANSSAR
jgi:TIGR03663 family protein